ncbi:MAG: hypothetical protein ABIA04_01545 [Pseudomonadota bacterium]
MKNLNTDKPENQVINIFDAKPEPKEKAKERKPTVYIMEVHEPIIKRYISIFKKLDIEYTFFDSFDELIKASDKSKADFLIIDIPHYNMSYYMANKWLLEQKNLIVTTYIMSKELYDKFIKSNNIKLLVKPINWDQIENKFINFSKETCQFDNVIPIKKDCFLEAELQKTIKQGNRSHKSNKSNAVNLAQVMGF